MHTKHDQVHKNECQRDLLADAASLILFLLVERIQVVVHLVIALLSYRVHETADCEKLALDTHETNAISMDILRDYAKMNERANEKSDHVDVVRRSVARDEKSRPQATHKLRIQNALHFFIF